MTQIPAKLDEDIYHEVKAEEFIVERPTALSGLNAQTTSESGVDGKVSPPKTETPKTPVVIQSSQQLSSDVTTEGSGGSMERSGHAHTTPLSVSHTPTTQPGMDRFPAFLVSDQSLTDFTTEGSADPTSSTLLLEGSGFSPSATTIQTSQQTFTGVLAEGSGTTQSAALFEGGSELSPTTTTTVSHTQSPASTTESVRDSTAASPTPEPTEVSTKTRALEEPLREKRIKSRLMQKKFFELDELANGKIRLTENIYLYIITAKQLIIFERAQCKTVFMFLTGEDYQKPDMHKGHSTPGK